MNQTQQSDQRTSGTETILEVEDLRKQFGGLVAVDDVSFEVKSGEILGVIGPNGAGKTTLFNVINGFLNSDGGSVQLNGGDLTDVAPNALANQGLARTFQLVKPFGPLTVIENVMVGAYLNTTSRKEARSEAARRLELLGLSSIADAPAQEITVAEKKKMELCRALATDPEIILVDEIMAGLQKEERREILDALYQINETGTSIVLIEHVMDALMEISERIIVLNEGRLVANGAPDEVASKEEVIEAYLGEGWREEEDKEEVKTDA